MANSICGGMKTLAVSLEKVGATNDIIAGSRTVMGPHGGTSKNYLMPSSSKVPNVLEALL